MTQQAQQLIAKAKAEKRTRLDLGNCGLTDLAAQVPELFTLTDLEELVLSNGWYEWNEAEQKWERKESANTGTPNKIDQLPDALGRLSKLRVFICGGERVERWNINDINPLSSLTALTTLFLHENQLTNISPLSSLTALTTLFLHENQLTDISPLSSLTALVELYLQYNQLIDVSPLASLSVLRVLALDGNQLADITPLASLSDLVLLNLGGNRLANTSPLSGLTALKTLNLEYNQLTDISSLANLVNLAILNVGGNYLRDVSPLSGLTALATLNIQYNQLTDISSLSGLTALTTLYLNSNELTDISPLSNLNTLIELDLSDNRLTNVSGLSGLMALTTLHLNSNELTDISPLSNLNALTKLDINSNQLKDVSGLLRLLQHKNPMHLVIKDYEITEREINVKNNPLQTPPLEIVQQGQEAVLRYLLQLNKDREQLKDHRNKEVKLILVGNSTVGKTTLAKYLAIENLSNSHSTTHWMERHTVQFGEHELRIFDFGGQEYYHDTHHLFFSQDTVYILLWNEKTNRLDRITTDIRYEEDGDVCSVELYHFPLAYWLEAIKFYTQDEQQNHSQNPILVVQTRVETLTDIHFLNQEEFRKNYPNIVNFVPVSLKANEQIPELQEGQLAYIKSQIRAMLEQMNILTKTYPGSWGKVKDAVVNYPDTEKPVLSLTEFKDFCDRALTEYQIFFSEAKAKDVCKMLARLGYLLYYDTMPEKVFVNQKHITQSVYDILKGLEKKEGKFDRTYVANKLSNDTSEQDQAIIDIMLSFRIIFQIENDYIAPLYLPENPIEPIKLFLANFSKPKVRFVYKAYIHKNIVLHFFAEFGKDVLQETIQQNELYYYWRNGIILANPENKPELILVRFDLERKSVEIIPFSQNNNSSYLESIIKKLRNLNKGWEVTELVTANGIDFVPLSEIRKNEREKYWLFQHEGKQFFLKDFKEYLRKKPFLQKMFISYSSKDIDYLRDLEVHLSMLKREGYIETWHDRKLTAGEEWDRKIKQELETADIILMLLSPDFIATDYIWDIEVKKAMERHNNGSAVVIPIILRPCQWERTPLAKLTTAQPKAEPVSTAKDRDTIWLEIVNKIRVSITELGNKRK
jgi:Leucine-rich repeat (LRR) protein/GTPase SAR1 family protein